MSRIKDAAKAIQKNLCLEDYASKTVSQQDSVDKPLLMRKHTKKKVTFYFDVETEDKLNEVFVKKIISGNKMDKSNLIKKAVQLLWEDEKNHGK